MPSFEYTNDFSTPDSSVVSRVFYNANTKVMFVNLHGSVYSYSDVPRYVYDEFETAKSAGHYYSTTVKGQYSGNSVGSSASVSVYKTVDRTVPVEKKSNVVHLSGIVQSVNEPKTRLTLAPEAPKNDQKFEFGFTVGDSKVEKTYPVTAMNQDVAAKKLLEIADALDLTFNVKWVKIYL